MKYHHQEHDPAQADSDPLCFCEQTLRNHLQNHHGVTINSEKLICPDVRKDPSLHFEYEIYPNVFLDGLDIEYDEWQTILLDNEYLSLVLLVNMCRWNFTRWYAQMHNCDHDGWAEIYCQQYDHIKSDRDDVIRFTKLDLCPIPGEEGELREVGRGRFVIY